MKYKNHKDKVQNKKVLALPGKGMTMIPKEGKFCPERDTKPPPPLPLAMYFISIREHLSQIYKPKRA